jgi:hypothetical protein
MYAPRTMKPLPGRIKSDPSNGSSAPIIRKANPMFDMILVQKDFCFIANNSLRLIKVIYNERPEREIGFLLIDVWGI